jgi:hypothetical protein
MGLYEFKEEFMKFYRDLLSKDPSNKEASNAMKKLADIRVKFDGTNRARKEQFVKMNTKNEYKNFEEWLAKLWN